MFHESLFPELTCLPQGSHANLIASPGSAKAATTGGISGQSSPALLASLNPDGSWLRTSPASSPAMTRLLEETIPEPTLAESFPIWPRSGMTRSGSAYALPMLERPTSGKECSYWPTPTSAKAGNDLGLTRSGDGRKKPNKLGWAVAVEMLPTPTANDAKNSTLPPSQRGRQSLVGELMRQGERGHLNPAFSEWLMGFPIGYTALEPSGTP